LEERWLSKLFNSLIPNLVKYTGCRKPSLSTSHINAQTRMTRKYIKKILSLNSKLFPLLAGVAFLFLFFETYMYIGFIRKFVIFDSRFFMAAAIVSSILLVFTNENLINKFILRINKLMFPVVLISYLVMQYLEAVNYPNYVFTMIHLQPQNFFYIVVLSGILFLIGKVNRKDVERLLSGEFGLFKKNQRPLEIILHLVIVTLLAFYFIDNFTKTITRVVNSSSYILTHLGDTYDDKMRKKWGFYYDYMIFVRDHTPPHSTIVIPPQTGHWLSTGNMPLSRHFLYPRKVFNGELYGFPLYVEYDFVLISRGLWLSNANDWGWPKVNVGADKIWYIDRDSLEVTELKGDFDADDPFNKDAWGIIEVRKENK
jgi:hypothetical protein